MVEINTTEKTNTIFERKNKLVFQFHPSIFGSWIRQRLSLSLSDYQHMRIIWFRGERAEERERAQTLIHHGEVVARSLQTQPPIQVLLSTNKLRGTQRG